MKENQPISTNHVVKRSLEAVAKPWSKQPRSEIAEAMESIKVPVIEIARRAHVSPTRVTDELPGTIAFSGTVFAVRKDRRIPNLRIKKLIRESVKEPPIKGMRNGRKRPNGKVLERKIQQAKAERQRIVFRHTSLSGTHKEKERKRAAVHAKIAERAMKKTLTPESDIRINVSESNTDLQILRSLVHVSTKQIRQIVENALNHPDIHLFDFVKMLGLNPNDLDKLRENTQLIELLNPKERTKKAIQLKELIDNTTTLHPLSKTRIHPSTPFEDGVPLFFGMGGGSQMPCQGLPIDVLKMVLTGEKLRRKLGLSKCWVLGADVITYTNIGRTEGFTKERVDQVIGTEIAIMNEIFRRFGFPNWQATKQSQLRDNFSEQKVKEWEQNIREADDVDFVGGHHYAIEMSDIQLLVPKGIKLGWWIRPLTRGAGYIMDEQPFHARFALVMALLGKPHATTLLYTHAGSRILLGEDGQLQKEAPYITYTPDRRLLLSPFENIPRKLEWGERRGGGLSIPFVHEQMTAIVELFEELVHKLPAIGRTSDEILANKLQLIVREGVGDDRTIENMWREAFPNAL